MAPQQLDENFLERMHMMSAITSSDAGISFLQLLCRLTGFNKPVMSLEDASRRDVWLSIRPFIEVGKLSLIEHHDLREQQLQMRETINALLEEKQEDE